VVGLDHRLCRPTRRPATSRDPRRCSGQDSGRDDTRTRPPTQIHGTVIQSSSRARDREVSFESQLRDQPRMGRLPDIHISGHSQYRRRRLPRQDSRRSRRRSRVGPECAAIANAIYDVPPRAFRELPVHAGAHSAGFAAIASHTSCPCRYPRRAFRRFPITGKIRVPRRGALATVACLMLPRVSHRSRRAALAIRSRHRFRPMRRCIRCDHRPRPTTGALGDCAGLPQFERQSSIPSAARLNAVRTIHTPTHVPMSILGIGAGPIRLRAPMRESNPSRRPPSLSVVSLLRIFAITAMPTCSALCLADAQPVMRRRRSEQTLAFPFNLRPHGRAGTRFFNRAGIFECISYPIGGVESRRLSGRWSCVHWRALHSPRNALARKTWRHLGSRFREGWNHRR